MDGLDRVRLGLVVLGSSVVGLVVVFCFFG